jgi:hypothetical protein
VQKSEYKNLKMRTQAEKTIGKKSTICGRRGILRDFCEMCTRGVADKGDFKGLIRFLAKNGGKMSGNLQEIDENTRVLSKD